MISLTSYQSPNVSLPNARNGAEAVRVEGMTVVTRDRQFLDDAAQG
jgi:hypothetical protein